MASISVRKLDSEVIGQLKILAAHNGVSMEEQARRILTQQLMPQENLGDLAVGLFSEFYDEGDQLELPPREHSEPLKFVRAD